MGVPVPAHMDGSVLQEILTDNFQPVQTPAGDNPWPGPFNGDGSGLTKEEEQILADRLRSLGYVG